MLQRDKLPPSSGLSPNVGIYSCQSPEQQSSSLLLKPQISCSNNAELHNSLEFCVPCQDSKLHSTALPGCWSTKHGKDAEQIMEEQGAS